MENRACCFIGHRKVQDKERVYACVRRIVEMLIKDNGVGVFNFGSKSEFNDICHRAVTELQSDYPNIVRVMYHCKSEYAVRKDEKVKFEEFWSSQMEKVITFKDFDEAKTSDRILKAGRASYVVRNREMIDDSDICVFFFKDEYKPVPSPYYQASEKSGTRLAYDYAVRKKKIIINIAGLI